MNENFVNIVLINLFSLKLNELANIDRCKIALGRGNKTKIWKRLPGSLNEPVEMYQSGYKGEGTKVFVKGVAIIDEEVEVILGNIMHFNSNQKMNGHIQMNGNTERTWCYGDYSHTCHYSLEVNSPAPFKNRKFSGYQTFMKGFDNKPGSYVVAIYDDSKDTTNSNSSSSGAVLGGVTALFVLGPIAPMVTRVIQVQLLDLKFDRTTFGSFSNLAANAAFGVLKSLHIKYQRLGSNVDKEIREEFISNITLAPPLSLDQQDLINKCLLLGSGTDFTFNELKSTSRRIKHFQMYNQSAQKEKTAIIGKAVAEIDVSAAEVLSWLWNWTSNEKMTIHREDDNSVSRSVVEYVSTNETITETTKRFPPPFKNRQFVTRAVWSGSDDFWLVFILLRIFR